MSDEKSPARISHRHFATSRSEMESIMHKVQAKAILSAKNGMNIYRGCQHGCIYCDARSTCYQMNHVFEDIEVKENAPQLLEAALKRISATGGFSFLKQEGAYMLKPLEKIVQ